METIGRNQATAAQIQRLEDAAQNSLTGKTAITNFFEILDSYHKSQVMILSGKTALATATELASRVADEMGVVLGKEVGYQIRGDNMTNKNKEKKTRLAYMTEGVLLRQLCLDKTFTAYVCAAIDEAHEQIMETDICFLLLVMK